MFSRLSLNSVFVFFLLLTSTSAFAIDAFQQTWSGLDDKEYIENLVSCKTTIKELQWSYNIWPKENKTKKPSFTELVNKDQIYSSVVNNLKKQTVLANEFGIEISAEMLQGELDRMARDTKDPRRLQELFASLNNSPASIAECVARPNLVNRFLQEQYKNSPFIHGELHRQAKADLLHYQQTSILDSFSAEVYTVDYVIEDIADEVHTNSAENDPAKVKLDQHAFTEKLNKLDDLASRTIQLQELDSAFVYEEIIEESPSSIKVKVLVWPKDSLNSWLTTQDSSIQASPVSQLVNNLLSIEVSNSKIEAASATASATLGGPPDTWKDFSTIPRIRRSHTAIWTGTEMIVWGGTGSYSGLLLNTGSRYNPTTGLWLATSIADAPLARHSHTTIWTGSEMIVWGGYAGSDNVSNTGGRYNPLTDSWTPTSSTDAPQARRVHTAIWTGSEMVVWGGNADTDQILFLDSGGRYNPSTNSWIATSTTNAPAGRWVHSAVWTGEEMIIWGGGIGLNTRYKTGGHYNPSTDMWVATETVDAPEARGLHSAVWTETQMIIWGGANAVNTKLVTGSRYNPNTRTWVETSTTNAAASTISYSTVWTGSEMIVWGGATQFSNLNTGGRYNPVSDTWTATSTVNAPSGRAAHSAVWAGSEMIVFGGAAGTIEFQTGGRYNPLNDSWKTTESSLVTTLSARNLHSAVWSGSEMIVWGGVDVSTGWVNTGSRYDPVTDYWRTMTLTDAPEPRAKHSAHWTGTEMLVWGGSRPEKLDTGGLYDPTADTWSTITTANAPTARESHSSIWTGTEMIVWGGNDGSLVNTGARYDPDLDSWSPVTTTDAPTARDLHSAVWTDTEMIVWGGSDNNTGGRYDPGSNTWIATETLDAPAARDSHSAIWTGTEMIIWGGRDLDTGLLDSGARYNPGTGLWTEVSLVNGSGAPTSRYLHSAVWTSTDMLIWGGLDTRSVNTGSSYNPDTDTWTAISTTDVPTARQQHVTVWTGVDMVVWGGVTGASRLNTGGRYNPETDKWRAVTTTNRLNWTRNHSAIWTGENMIVWGGSDKTFQNLNTGASYDIATDLWTPLATMGAPAPSSFPSVVWTGSEMIVYSGEVRVGISLRYTNTGALYDPVTDSWSDTQTDNAPTGRQGIITLWTGTEMIVWGGGADDGAGYNPLSNTWTAIADAPFRLATPTVQWTGTEMIVWGGTEAFVGATARGLRYTPSTNSWLEMTSANTPDPRTGPRSVWTGSELVIWGGTNNGSLITGGRYNPASDSWTPTSTPPITKRRFHSMIWTGFEVLVWGGNQEGSLYPNNGARYNPDTDTWKTMALTNGPSGTRSHKAVWTGHEMIIWGGHSSSYSNALGIYYPQLEALPELIFGGPGGSFEEPEPDPGN